MGLFVPGKVLGYMFRGKEGGKRGFAVIVKGFRCYGRLNSLVQLLSGDKKYIILVAERRAKSPVGCMYLSRDRKHFVIRSRQNGVVLTGWVRNLEVMFERGLARAPVHERLKEKPASFLPLDVRVIRGGKTHRIRVGVIGKRRGGMVLEQWEVRSILDESLPFRFPFEGFKWGVLSVRPVGGALVLSRDGEEIITTRQGLEGLIKKLEKIAAVVIRFNGSFIRGIKPVGWKAGIGEGGIVLIKGKTVLNVKIHLEKPSFRSSTETKVMRRVGVLWCEGIMKRGRGKSLGVLKAFVGSLRMTSKPSLVGKTAGKS